MICMVRVRHLYATTLVTDNHSIYDMHMLPKHTIQGLGLWLWLWLGLGLRLGIGYIQLRSIGLGLGLGLGYIQLSSIVSNII